jgi:hypothetical protein
VDTGAAMAVEVTRYRRHRTAFLGGFTRVMRGFSQRCANYGPLTNQRVAQKMIRAENPVESRHDANRRPLIPEQLLFQRKKLDGKDSARVIIS